MSRHYYLQAIPARLALVKVPCELHRATAPAVLLYGDGGSRCRLLDLQCRLARQILLSVLTWDVLGEPVLQRERLQGSWKDIH